MRANRAWLSFAILIAGSGAAHAQDVPPAKAQDAPNIVVTGRPEVSPEVARHFVTRISSPIDGQMPQFRDPVCPLVLGFPAKYNLVIQDRIRRIARDAGIALARANCRANLVLLVAKDADGLVKGLRTQAAWLFEGVDDTDLKRAFADGPVHVWNATQLQNEDGKGVGDSTNQPPGKAAFEHVLDVKSASIFQRPTQRAIMGATVVIDRDATVNKTLTQIADYTAIRALSGARPPSADVQMDSILTLFDSAGKAPSQATQVDRSYLEGLYKSGPMAPSNSAMRRISKRIAKDSKVGKPGAN